MPQESATSLGAERSVSGARAPGVCRAASLLLAWPLIERAQFQELIPSHDILSSEGAGCLHLDLRFTHSMEQGPVMGMGGLIRVQVRDMR